MALPFVMLGKLALRSSVFSAELPPGHPRKVNPPVCIPFPDVVCFWRLKKDRLPWPQAKTLMRAWPLPLLLFYPSQGQRGYSLQASGEPSWFLRSLLTLTLYG